MQKHIQHNKDERRHFFRKIYLSHFIRERVAKGLILVMCERWVGDWTELQNIDPTLMAITAFLSRFSGLLNRGPGGPASLRHGPHSSIFSPTAQSGVMRVPSAGCWFSLQHLISNWPELPASVTISHSIQPLDSQGYILIFLDRMHLLFTQVHFLFWQLGRVGGQYATDLLS